MSRSRIRARKISPVLEILAFVEKGALNILSFIDLDLAGLSSHKRQGGTANPFVCSYGLSIKSHETGRNSTSILLFIWLVYRAARDREGQHVQSFVDLS